MNFESSRWIYQNIRMRGGGKTDRQTDRHTHPAGDKGGGVGEEREKEWITSIFSFWISENVYKPEMWCLAKLWLFLTV